MAAVPQADAGRRNMRLLVQLRWIAIGGQLITIGFVYFALGIALPLAQLLLAPALLMIINLATLPLLKRRTAITNAELTAALLMDVAALAWQLHYSGGLANPFTSLFLLQVVIGAILLKPSSSWAIVAVTLLALAGLKLHSHSLNLPTQYHSDQLGLYVQGSVVSFALIAVLLVAFVSRMARNLRQSDAALAAIRQRAAEEDHIVRMGLLASGAAHELGTPLSSLSVIIGDWQRIPRLAVDADLRDDLVEMASAVKRCKAIVSRILMSAGEARGEAPRVTSVRAFLNDIVSDLRAIRLPGTLAYQDDFGDDVAIVSDPALRQVIWNVIDNAAEVSPGWISIMASREDEALVLEIADKGPGFAADVLASFGQPYLSTKGKPGGGLGLFLLVNVARKLGGEAFASNHPHGGAIVRIRLPLATLAYEKDAPA